MNKQLEFLERTVRNKIEEYDNIYKNSDILIIEKKEKLEDINMYLNIILLLSGYKKQIKYYKKIIEKYNER
jgi:hypothetical protein